MNVFKTLLKKACEAAVSVSILLCCGIISVSAQSDFKAYIPDTENAGIVSGWEGKTLPLTDTYKPGDYLQRVIKFKDGSWWGLQLKRENNADVSNWEAPDINMRIIGIPLKCCCRIPLLNGLISSITPQSR